MYSLVGFSALILVHIRTDDVLVKAGLSKSVYLIVHLLRFGANFYDLKGPMFAMSLTNLTIM